MIARTSLVIAAARLRDAPDARRHSVEGRMLAHALRYAGPGGWLLHALVQRRFGRLLLRAFERIAFPGICAHYRWRKCWIQARVEDAITAGARQLLVLGAGMDPLPAHYARLHPWLRVFEIDRPPAIALKRKALQSGPGIPPNLHLVACDMACAGTPLPWLAHADFDSGAATVLVAEGVAMYLARERVLALLRMLRSQLPDGTRVIATAMQHGPDGAPGFMRQPRWVPAWLQRGGEPMLWGIPAAGLASTLFRHGLELVDVADDRTDPCPGESVFLARLHGLPEPSRMPNAPAPTVPLRTPDQPGNKEHPP